MGCVNCFHSPLYDSKSLAGLPDDCKQMTETLAEFPCYFLSTVVTIWVVLDIL